MNPDFLQEGQTLTDQIQAAVEMFLFLMAEISILFLAISALVGVINQKLPAEKVQKLLGSQGGRGYFLAAGLGAITPFCSCSTIPMLIGLLKARAGFGPTITFLITSPLLNPLVIALFIPVFGIKVTLVYAVLALTVSLAAGVLLERLGFERYIRQELLTGEVKASCCGSEASKAKEDKTEATGCCGGDKAAAQPLERAAATACCGSNQAEAKAESCCTDDEAVAIAKETGCCTPEEALKPDVNCCEILKAKEKQAVTEEEEEEETSCCGGDKAKPDVKAEATSCCGSDKAESKVKAEPTSCCGSDKPAVETKAGINWGQAWREAKDLYKEMFPYMAIAMVLGALVHGFVPTDFFAEVAGADNPAAVPVAAVIGIPLYIRVTALLPLVGSLVAKGVSLGAVMALTIGAGGASIPELIMLKRLFRWPLLLAFIGVILTMAIGGGLIFNAIA